MMMFEHPGHVKTLDGHDVQPLHEPRGPRVQGIRSEIRNPGMQPGQARWDFSHAFRLGDVHAFRHGFAGRNPGMHFDGFRLTAELQRQPTVRFDCGGIGFGSHNCLTGRARGPRRPPLGAPQCRQVKDPAKPNS